jgi:glycine/D-amino acid oxidase-like deaminating enzyme/nitrite reductase/ring-hydroxylating ferredoxin subunit
MLVPIMHDTTPHWSEAGPFTHFDTLTRDIHADAVVVGAGVTGLTVAYLLATAGKSVVVLERDTCAAADTGHTSAHLTMVTDTGLKELVDRFGRAHAQAVWDAGLASIAQIDEIIRKERIDADFHWVDGYLHLPPSATAADAEELERDTALANELGFDAEFVARVPVAGVPGIRFAGQARIHPRLYLAGVAQAITSAGGQIFEHAEATAFHTDQRAFSANGHTVTCDDLVIATNNPIAGIGRAIDATLLQTKLALYTSYVVSGRVDKGIVPDVLLWDTANAYGFLRVETHPDHDVVIYGGEDHKTGQEPDTDARFARIEARITELVPGITITHRWSGQVIETPDGLPYIGPTADHQYSATGYCGNGITFGTIAAMIMTDQLLGRKNPWAELFDPSRKALGRGLWDYIKENADYPYYMIRDRFAGTEGKDARSVQRGEGKILEWHGAKVAAYRDDAGAVTMRSAICTHLGCVVAWNGAERTWDCPCHGSRFKTTGEVIAGPAGSPLPAAR